MVIGTKKPAVDPRKAGSVEAALRRSLRAAVGGDWDAAETWLERIVEADTADLDAYHALARLYRQQGAVGRAIRMHQNLLLRADLGKAERLDALLELARDFDAGGFAERAVAGYEEVLDAQPRNGEALARLVALLPGQREYERALSLVKRLRRTEREVAEAAEGEILLSMAKARIDEGNADGARSVLKRFLRRRNQSGTAWAMLGELEAGRGRDARAIDAWKRGVQADPTQAAVLLPKIEAGFAARRKPRDFEKWLRGLLEERPADSAARIALARLLKARGDLREAIEELARAIEVAPDSSSLQVELGRQLLESGQEAEALKAYAGLLGALERGADERTLGPGRVVG